MKNKKSVFFLLPLVLFIWGLIIYEFFSYARPEPTNSNVQAGSTGKLLIKEKPVILIDINPRDPFSGSLDNGETKTAKPIRKVHGIGQKSKAELIWPTVTYHGIISDNNDNKKVYVLAINQKIFMMRKGDVQDHILVQEGNREMIHLQFEGVRRKFYIE